MPRSSKVSNPRRFDSNEAETMVKKYIDKINRQGLKFPTRQPLAYLLRPCRNKKNGGIGRPLNGYLIYRKDVWWEVAKNVSKANLIEISKVASERWKSESTEMKNSYQLLSNISTLIHNELSADTKNTTNEVAASSLENDLWESSALVPHMLLLPTERQALYLQPTGMGMVPQLKNKQMASQSNVNEQKFMTDFKSFLETGNDSYLDLLNSNKLDRFISSSYLSNKQ